MRALKLTALAGTAALALAGILSTTAAVSAPVASHSQPKVQSEGMGGGWHRGAWVIRPGTITLGAEYQLVRIRWSSWTSSGAYGQGHLLACDAFECERGMENIHVFNPHTHSGPGWYFKDLKYTGHHGAYLVIAGGGWAQRR
jgi:hypothetical protein